MRIDDLLKKPYWIIDILPKQVPKYSAGQYFTIEEYYLREPQASVLRKKLANIILRLNCYYNISIINEFDGDTADLRDTNPDPEALINLFVGDHARDYICILVEDEDTLIVSNRDDTYLTVYNPQAQILELLRLLSEAEGLFVWRPAEQ